MADTCRYDPAIHDSAAWLIVTCTRCGRSYQCTPFDDFIDPAPALRWSRGNVCEPCLLDLARAHELIEKGTDLP